MKVLLVFTLIIGLINGLAYPKNFNEEQVSNISPYTPFWFSQTLDHFDDENTESFSQRYFINDQFYDYTNGGPIILYINGEGPVSSAPCQTGDGVVLYGQALNAMIVTLEHRYYGESTPFQDLTTENLKYLSSEQALNDLAIFVVWFQSQLSNAGKIVTIGGSYSGALSAWFRIKYPHITSGSIASSGVVNAILQFTTFDEYVAYAAGEDCSNALRLVTKAVEEQILAGGSAEQKVKQIFQAESLTDNGDFFYWLADSMAEGIQYGFHSQLCSPLIEAMNNNGDMISTYSNYTINVWGQSLGTPEEYSTVWQQNTTADPAKADRQWWFQTCAALGYFQDAPLSGSIRSSMVNMTYFKTHCQQVFGIPLWPNTAAVNIHYGGNNTAGTNILYTNGSQDPWSRASVIQTISDSQQSVMVTCENCGHCVDIRASCPGGCAQPNNIAQVRALSIKLLESWLS
ncbi:hypothetical protein DICPUDRAFT_83068 [Dictyostelium purpureum]|uniref:Peptidase S28 family protein n=1 Tax=Dictyostelium purpureum TaxID=5786 RepID=F0ZYF9_DICPU|nr:uncharacterized protein DICPUDRAFT_83068 [Dictyostelium purpureum]EGC31013.1 hypothetical protein DICPUDRAFT_83068 [Dictyostelium purpureum]|eukprot:XP_003292451.1 hypothetical protein DICPUDRAFT_83068 [Dictyostelium purpureum]